MTGSEDQLLARVERARHDGRVPSIVAAVLRDGQVAWSAGVGSVDGRGGPAPTMDTAYRIGSITKSMVAAVVHQLVAEGRLALTDQLEDHVDVPATVADLRVGDVLAHGSGLRAETAPPWWERTPGRTRDDLWADLSDEETARPSSGGSLHYSNVGYGLLGLVVEALDGRTWFDAVRTRLLEPCGMDATVTSLPGLDAAAAARADTAAWVDLDAAVPLAVHPDRDALLVEPVHDYDVLGPAGQLWSTGADLAAWARVLAGRVPTVLGPEVLEVMARPRLVDGLSTRTAFGLGLQVRVHDDLVLIGHGGSVPGFVAAVLVAPATGTGVVVLANSTAGFGGQLALDLVDLARGVDPGPDPADDDQPHDDRAASGEAGTGPPSSDDLVGTWYWGPREVVVRSEDGELSLDLGTGPRRSRLRQVDDDHWIGRDAYFDGESVEVVRDAHGAVTHLEAASFVLTRQPYDPAEVVPGGIGAGWQPASGR